MNVLWMWYDVWRVLNIIQPLAIFQLIFTVWPIKISFVGHVTFAMEWLNQSNLSIYFVLWILWNILFEFAKFSDYHDYYHQMKHRTTSMLSQMLNMLFINSKQQKYERNLAKPTSVQGNIHHHIVGALMLTDPCFLCLFM